jgi:hypothetical protein
MSVPYVGIGARVCFGVESTWGTAVSRTHHLPLNASSYIRRVVSRNARGVLYTGSRTRKGFYQPTETVEGQLILELTYENFGLLWTHLFGTGSSTGAGPYVHSYTIATLDALGLTIEIVRGNGQAQVFEGCKFSVGRIQCRADGIMILTLNVVAETGGSLTSATSVSLGAGQSPVLGQQASQATFDSASFDYIGWTINLSNNLNYPRHRQGSVLSKEPSGGFAAISCSVDVDSDSTADTLYGKFLSGAQSDVVFAFVGTGNNAITFTVQNGYMQGSAPFSLSDGPLTQSFDVVGESDGTDLGLKVAVTNDNSSSTAN